MYNIAELFTQQENHKQRTVIVFVTDCDNNVSSDTHSDCRQLLLTHRVYPVCVCVCVVVQRGCDQYQLAGLLRQLLSRHPSIHAEPVRQLTA